MLFTELTNQRLGFRSAMVRSSSTPLPGTLQGTTL
jgi:hypothetical protein